jgi:hypothetical protein
VTPPTDLEPSATPDHVPSSRAARLRVGVLCWFASWVPFGLILGLSGLWLTVTLAFEIVLGIVGIALAGTSFANAIKSVGWRRAPATAFRTLITGTPERG